MKTRRQQRNRKRKQKQKQKRRQTQRGGKRIGIGVFSPPLKCSEDVPHLSTEEYVSKFFLEEEVAKEDYENGMKLQAIDPEQNMFITPLHMCKASEQQTNENKPAPLGQSGQPGQSGQSGQSGYLIIYKNGGAPISRFSEKQKITCIKAVIPLLKVIHENGFVHFDLHEGNIVFDGTRTRLIDFNSLTSFDSRRPEKDEEYKFHDIDALFTILYKIYSNLEYVPKEKLIEIKGEAFANWIESMFTLAKELKKTWTKPEDCMRLSDACVNVILACPV